MSVVVAKVNDQEIANSSNTILVEGNHYFPVEDVNFDLLSETDQETTCHWKGKANYYTVKAGDSELRNAAWTYHEPISDRAEPIRDYVAFYQNMVQIEEKSEDN